jgi:hypothetical protein
MRLEAIGIGDLLQRAALMSRLAAADDASAALADIESISRR